MSIKRILKILHISHRTGIGYVAAFLMLVTAWPTPIRLLVAGGLALVGAAIRFWASGSVRKDEVLAQTGPFALVRNPLYLGSGVIATGFVFANWNPFFIGLVGSLLAILYLRTIRKEESLLKARFGEEYEVYCRAVPRVLPVRRPYGGWKSLRVGFSVRQALRNQEGDAILGTAALLGVLSIPAFTGRIGLFRLVITAGLILFFLGRGLLFPILKSDSQNRFVRILQFLFTRKKYSRIRVP